MWHKNNEPEELGAGLLTHGPEGGRKRGPQPPHRVSSEVPDDPGAIGTRLLDGQLDADVGASIAVVKNRHGPRHARLVVVAVGVVVESEVNGLLHEAVCGSL
jgi:hypothetical protein